MRLIDADALLKQIAKDSRGKEGWYGDAWEFINTINDAPTIDTALTEKIVREISYPDATIQEVIGELVRCKDCRYYVRPFSDSASAASQESAGADPERWCCRLGLVGVFENDDYCSYGVRKAAESE